MWTRSSIRDLLETMAAAAPESGDARVRVRAETLRLLLALFGPRDGEPDPARREQITRALDALMADRASRAIALEPA
jgi:hypothetical protein